MWHSMLVFKLFHGTPMYSQAPQLQQELFNSHRFNMLASTGLFATTLPPWQLESGYSTLLLKTLQRLLILTIRYYMILWHLWPHLLLSPLTQLWPPRPFCYSWNIPGMLWFQDLCTECLLYLVFFPQMSLWLVPFLFQCLARTMPSPWSLPWPRYSNTVLYSSPTSSTFYFP